MPYRKYVFLVLLIEVLFSCRNLIDSEHEKIVEELIGKEIFLPLISKNSELFNPKVGLKIVTIINGNCYPCLSDLKDWGQMVKEITEKYQVPIITYLVIADSSMFLRINRKEIHFDYPVIFDANNMFKRMNKLPQKSLYHTMLLSDSNHIMLIGNPTKSIRLKELYIKVIKNSNQETNE